MQALTAALLEAALVASCAQRPGSHESPAVRVFEALEEIPSNCEKIGTGVGRDPAAIGEEANALRELQEKAKTAGANAVLVRFYEAGFAGESGCEVSAGGDFYLCH